MSELQYDTLVVRREGLTRDLPAGGNEDLRWVANSATLIFGDADAVLVDTFLTIEQNQQLVDWVKGHDRRLTYLYLTHGHADHVYGIGQVLQAFPDAQAVATAGTAAQARVQGSEQYRNGFYSKLFPGQIPEPVVPAEMAGDRLIVEGHELRVLEAGHTDTSATTVLWCPSVGLLVAGDVVYNDTHMYLGETTTASRQEWIATLTRLKELDPRYVVAGHRQPGGTDTPGNIDDSIQYLIDFDDAAAHTSTPIELYQAVLGKYPRRANPGSLWGAAKLVKSA